jgi:primary-amine oxidase
MSARFAWLTVAVCLFTLRGAAAQTPAHPLDALTAEEYWTVFEVLKASGKVDQQTRYPAINLQEPPKAAVLKWKKGEPFTREALVVVRQGANAYEAVVDITARRVSSWTRIEGMPNVTREDFGWIEGAITGNAEVQAALKKRGITDFETLDCFGMVLGNFGTELERGRRLVRGTCLDRRGASSGQFRPVDGLVTLIDYDTRKVLKVIDTGVRPMPRDSGEHEDRPRTVSGPLLVQQPGGPGYQLEGQLVRWQNWSFHFRIDPKAGSVVSLVRYLDEGRDRSVMYQGYLSEIFVPYMDPSEDFYFINFLDIGETPQGRSAPLEPGADCPMHASYFDSVSADARGIPATRRRTACLFEREAGDVAWRHSDGPSQTDSRARRDLVLRQISTIGNYDYLLDWVFQQDGTFKVVAGATGQVNVRAVPAAAAGTASSNGSGNGNGRSSAARVDAYGRLIANNLLAVNHDHFLSFRLDLDVDGPANSFVVDKLVPRQLPPESPRRSIWVVDSSTVRSESEGKLAGHAPSLWRVINPAAQGKVGYPTSYQLKPGHSATSLLSADDNPQVRAGFSQYQLWVTAQNDRERFAAGAYPTGAATADGLPVWTKANRPVENADLVVWYTMGMHHVVRAEDYPIMPVTWHELEIRPFDFFKRNPAIDLPRVR